MAVSKYGAREKGFVRIDQRLLALQIIIATSLEKVLWKLGINSLSIFWACHFE